MKRTLRKKLDTLWSKTVRERDMWCCRHIGKTYSSRLNAHHIITKSTGDILRWDVINGITLCCMPCHKWHDGSAHQDPNAFNKWYRKSHPSQWAYLQRQKHKKIYAKDRHYEIIKTAIETQTAIIDIEKELM